MRVERLAACVHACIHALKKKPEGAALGWEAQGEHAPEGSDFELGVSLLLECLCAGLFGSAATLRCPVAV
jgi:hypothetical protein